MPDIIPDKTGNGPLLVAENVSQRVAATDQGDELQILDSVSLQVSRGESLAIVGASGSGKTTLLGLLAGLDSPSNGRITIDGVELTMLDEDGRAALRAGQVGFVFQDFNLLPAMTALDNVMLPLELAGLPEAKKRATGHLEQVGLGDRLTHYPRQLSGGEQQRVALARAFVTEPTLLFADEPTGSLDNATGSRIIDLLFGLNKTHATTLILVTHDRALASRCDRVIEMQAGRLV